MPTRMGNPNSAGGEDEVRPIKVMLVDPHTLMREGIRSLLCREGTIAVVQESASGAETLAQMGRSAPDVVLMDVDLPDRDGIAVAREIQVRWPGTRVIMLTTHEDPDRIHAAFTAGAVGYLTKSVSGQELTSTITQVMKGRTVLPRSALPLVCERHRQGQRPAPWAPPGQPAGGLLSKRECEVLGLVAGGCDTDEIAERLYISPKTVKTHLQNIFAKLDVSNRLQAVVKGNSLGLLQPGHPVGRTVH